MVLWTVDSSHLGATRSQERQLLDLGFALMLAEAVVPVEALRHFHNFRGVWLDPVNEKNEVAIKLAAANNLIVLPFGIDVFDRDKDLESVSAADHLRAYAKSADCPGWFAHGTAPPPSRHMSFPVLVSLRISFRLRHAASYDKDGEKRYLTEVVVRPFNGSISLQDKAPTNG